MPLPATIFCPEFIRIEKHELQALLNQCRDPLALHIFFLVVTQANFKTGELLTNYARLIELCTPPQPERGKRMPGPTLKQVRRAVDWLLAADLLRRDAEKNAAQGQLRLYVRRRNNIRSPKTKEGRV